MNYTNPMAVLTNVMNTYGGVNTVGLCHSVQACVPGSVRRFGHGPDRRKVEDCRHQPYGMAAGGDVRMVWILYPEIKRRAAKKQKEKHHDMVRFELMLKFGYYITESSEHNAEYHPYFIKTQLSGAD